MILPISQLQKKTTNKYSNKEIMNDSLQINSITAKYLAI